MQKIRLENSSSFDNLVRAHRALRTSIDTPVTEPRDLSGIIKDFEMVFELSWKVLKKRLLEDGHQSLGAKDVFTQAFKLGLIDQEDSWLAMIGDRNRAAQVYDENSAKAIVDRVKTTYIGLIESTFAL